MQFKAGDTIDEKYKVLSILGSGGFGSVYLVNELQLNRTVALKVLTKFSVHDPIHLKRFEREAQILSKMSHPNIVGIHRFAWIEDKAPYLVLENVQGESLRDRLTRESTLRCADAVEIARQTAVALSYAHSNSVTHRDLKPENLLITSDERDGIFVKLIDFGLSKQSRSLSETLTDTGAVFGTPNYMSPEHCLGKELTFQSDIYSLGCILFEMICGAPPFESQNLPETIFKQVSEATPSVASELGSNQVSKKLDKIIATCTSKNPEQRYQDYDSLIEALNDDTLLACKEKLSTKRIPQGITRKRKVPVIGAITLALIALVVGGTALFNFQYSMNGPKRIESLIKSAEQDCPGCSRAALEYLKFEKLQQAGFKTEAREQAFSTLKTLMKSCREKIEANPTTRGYAIDRKDIEILEKISKFLMANTTERAQWSRIHAVVSERSTGDTTDDVLTQIPLANNAVKLRITAILKKGAMNPLLADELIGYCWRLKELGDKEKKQYIDLAGSLVHKYPLERRECEFYISLTDFYIEQGDFQNARKYFSKAESLLKELRQADSDAVGYLDNNLNNSARALRQDKASKSGE